MTNTTQREEYLNHFSKMINKGTFKSYDNVIKRFLTCGAYTHVYELYPCMLPNDYNFKDPVLVISCETSKAEIFKNVTGLPVYELSLSKVEQLKEEVREEILEFEPDLEDFELEYAIYENLNTFNIDQYFEEMLLNNFSVYITERVDNIELDKDTEIDFENLLTFFENKLCEESINIVYEDLNFFKKRYEDSFYIFKNDFTQNLFEQILVDMQRILDTTPYDYTMNLDLHSGQFVKCGDKIHLIDAFIYDC